MVPHTSNHKNLIAFTGGLTNRICISKKPQRQQCFWGFLFGKKQSMRTQLAVKGLEWVLTCFYLLPPANPGKRKFREKTTSGPGFSFTGQPVLLPSRLNMNILLS